MPEHVEEILRDFETYYAKMRKEIPETRDAFNNLLGTVHKDGALPAKMKEIICVAISIYAHCESCMIHHTRQALEAGATKAEIMEACAAAIVMGGGPATAAAPIVMKAIEKWGK
ncbi:MAG: carboxymuconolactone decarboxylase family protein [Candidatus Atabeyarchaeum deiterrae]